MGLAGAGLFALPWVLRGALGSPLDVVLAVLLGLVFGVAVALLLQRLWLPSLEHDSRGRSADIFTGGLVAGAALVIMASGLSLNGLQLVLMVALPALGWLAVVLSTTWLPSAILVGGATATILAFIDVSPLALEAGDPALGWAWQAAAISVVLGWILALTAWLLRDRVRSPVQSGVAWAGAAVCWLIAALLFLTGGQPGFFGDRLFVIMNDQADVSAAAQMDDYDRATPICI